MSNEYFNQAAEGISSRLSEGESIDDIRALFASIVKARKRRRDLGEVDARIALFSLCFFGLPGKAASYRREIVNFRRAFAGISRSAELRARFQACLKDRLLLAETIEDLVPLTHIRELFAESGGDDKGTGARSLGLPPLKGPDFKPHLETPTLAQSQTAPSEAYTV